MKNIIPEWLLKDNKKRSKKYKRNLDDELFLQLINNKFKEFEIKNESSIQRNLKPIIFFFGMPRNGKTLFSQILTNSLDLGFPNNLIARFFKAPSVGIRLTKMLEKYFDDESELTSDYGKTLKLNEPHDFAYFWQDLFKIKNIVYDYKFNEKKIDWCFVKKKLNIFANTFNKALLFKGFYPSYHINKINEVYRNSYFIYIKRDFIDCAISLTKARVRNYNNKNKWFGQTPSPNQYNKLKLLPYYEQIGGQFYYLEKMIEDSLKKIPKEKKLIINYKDLCTNPQSIILNIRNNIKNVFKYEIPIKSKPNRNKIKFSTYSSKNIYYSKLAVGLKKFNLKKRE